MAAFEQSLTTLNTRLRQLTTLNETKDNEIEQLRQQLNNDRLSNDDEKRPNASPNLIPLSPGTCESSVKSDLNESVKSSSSDQNLLRHIEDLKKQLVEKDRLLTDMRLEALSAAHQLEQLESKMDGDHSLVTNEDDLDEGVLLANHSPSDSDAITDSPHFSETTSQANRTSNKQYLNDNSSSMPIFDEIGVKSNSTSNDRQGQSDNNSLHSNDRNLIETDRRSRNSDDLSYGKLNMDGEITNEMNLLIDGLCMKD